MRRAMLCLAVSSLSFLPVTRAAEAPPPPEADAALFRAVVQLADPNSEVRDDATRTLWKAGRAAEPVLRRAIEVGDPEIAARAREILADFQLGIDPDAPAEIVEQLRNYRRSNSLEEKKRIIEALAKRGRIVYPALARVYLSEKDERVRQEAFGEVAQEGLNFAAAFLAQGDHASAERLLEMSTAMGVPHAARAYGIFLAMAPQAKDSVAAIEKRLTEEKGKASAAAVLAYHHRARGDLVAARRMAEQAGDDELIERIQLEQRDYRAAADRRMKALDETDVTGLSITACYLRLAGDDKAADRLAESMKRLATGDAPAMMVSRLLALVDRPADGLALWDERDRPEQRYEMLLSRQRMDEALKLGEKTLFERHHQAWLIRPHLVRLYHQMGRADEGNKMLDALAGEVRRGAEGVDVGTVVWAARVAHLDERAFKEAATGLRNGGDEGEGRVLTFLFPQREQEASVWLRYFRSRHPGDAIEASLQKVRGVMEGSTAGDEVRRLAQDAAGNRRALGRDVPGARRALANTLHEADEHAAAA